MKLPPFFVLAVYLLSGCYDKPGPVPQDTRLIIFPNPATIRATIQVNVEGKPFTLKAYNAKGKLELNVSSTGQQAPYQWDLPLSQFQLDLPEEGVYTAVLTVDGKEIRQEVIRP